MTNQNFFWCFEYEGSARHQSSFCTEYGESDGALVLVQCRINIIRRVFQKHDGGGAWYVRAAGRRR